MSPTSPTYVALYKQLGQAHRRIRELEAGEAELLAQIRILCAVITDLTHEVHARSAIELTSSTVLTSSPDDGSDRRFGIGDPVDKSQTTQSACPPAAHSQATASRPASASTSRIGAKRTKTPRPHVV
jgi:hypothetical protein